LEGQRPSNGVYKVDAARQFCAKPKSLTLRPSIKNPPADGVLNPKFFKTKTEIPKSLDPDPEVKNPAYRAGL
jgi:hypothetical protein